MPERPLLILPTPTEPAKRSKKTGGGGRPHLPSPSRQAERLTPRFTVLQETLDARRARLRTESSGVIPEEVIVLETVGPIDNFIVAVRKIEGLEWLGEVEEEDIPPDDDFFIIDPARVSECTEYRVTALGGGLLRNNQAHVHRVPLPPSLSAQRCWRRLVITLAGITPVN